MVFSRGELFISLIKEALSLPGCILNIKWEDGPASFFCKDDDKTTFIVYNPAKEQFVTFQNITTRSAKEVSLKLPDKFKNDTVHCWKHYVNVEENAVSTGVYIGEIMVL